MTITQYQPTGYLHFFSNVIKSIKSNNYIINLSYFVLIFLSINQIARSQEIDIWSEVYFKDKAKNFSIIAAKFATESYFYAKKAALSSYNRKEQNDLADTSILLGNQALLAADSALTYVEDSLKNDSIIEGIAYLKLSKQYIVNAKRDFSSMKYSNKIKEARQIAYRAMFETGNSLVDAYNASLYLSGSPLQKDTIQNNEFVYVEVADSSKDLPFGGFKIKNSEERNRQIKRLEADETTYSAIVELYENNINSADKQLSKNDSILNAKINKKEKDSLLSDNELLKSARTEYKDKLDESNKSLKELRDILTKVLFREAEKVYDHTPIKPSEFKIDNTGFYNFKNPIPLVKEDKAPQGLAFKVQIGYYSINSRPKWFEGLSPITGYMVSDKFIRYTTGIFYDFDEADKAKDAVRKKGIHDAFVIAYYNDEKISISKAIRLWLDEIQKEKDE